MAEARKVMALISLVYLLAAFGTTTACDANQQPAGSKLRLLLVGKTGSGKSTSGNTILGKEVFPTSVFMGSETSQCQLETGQRFGRTIEVMDSPGLFDTSKPELEIASIIIKSVAGMSPGPHAVLYTVQIGQRYTEEEAKSYQRLKTYFGDSIANHTIVLLTHGNMLRGKNITVTIEDYLQKSTKEFQKVFRECGNRYVVFDIMEEDQDAQVQRLLNAVEDMLAGNDGLSFESELTERFAEKMEELVRERVEEVERKDFEGSKLYQDMMKDAEKNKHELEKLRKDTEKMNAELRDKRKAEEEMKLKQEIVHEYGWYNAFRDLFFWVVKKLWPF